MLNTTAQKHARACVRASARLLEDIGAQTYQGVDPDELMPAVALLDIATKLVDPKIEAREKKNAGDRARRARTRKTSRAPRAKRKPKPAITLASDGFAED